MKGLVIDIRNNPGGLLDTVVGMLKYMLPDGLIVYTEDKQGNIKVRIMMSSICHWQSL